MEDRKLRSWEDEKRTGFPPEFILSNSKGGNDRRGEKIEDARMRNKEKGGLIHSRSI